MRPRQLPSRNKTHSLPTIPLPSTRLSGSWIVSLDPCLQGHSSSSFSKYAVDLLQPRSTLRMPSTNLSASRQKADVPGEEASRAAAEQVALRSLDETQYPPLGRS